MTNQVLSVSTTMVSQNHVIDTEEAIIMEHVKATHNPRGEMDVDASSILDFVDDIFNSDTIPLKATQDKLTLKEYIQNEISSHVLQLSLMVACSCLNNVDSHSIAICLLTTLSVYPWHTKAVMMLTSFAIIYGKFKVVSQSRQRRELAYNLALSKQMSSSNPKYLEDNSIKSALDLVKLMVELKHSSPMIVANYWIARFVVAYTRLCILDPESQIQLSEQSKLSTKIKEIMASSHSLLEAKRAEENYQALLHAFDNSSDILEVLKLIFDVKNDEDEVILHLKWLLEKLDRGIVQKKISPCRLDLFRGKEVLLLISSGRHFPSYVYNAPRGVQMIWVPITKVEKMGLQIIHNYVHLLGSVMIRHKPVAQVFRRFLEDKCFPIFQVGGDPIVISLDKRGRLVHYNALHMILTWRYQLYEETTMNHDLLPSLENELRERTLGADRVIGDIDKQIHDFASQVRKNINNWVNDIKDKMRSSFRSYNYTSEREQTLNGKESWSFKLVVSYDIFYGSKLDEWVADEEYIFLCGGNNNKQVQEFILRIQEICSKIQMNWRIIYIGRSEKTLFDDEVRRMCDSTIEKYSIKRFWTRLQSMASSRIQYLFKMGLDEGSDEIMQGVKNLLVYEAEGSTVGVWGLLSKGNGIIACDMGDKMLGVMNEYEKWKDNAQINGFDRAFKDCYEMMLSSSSSTSYHHPCCFLNYPSNLDKIPNTQSCPQCDHNMHKFVTFSCCHTFMDR
ncbi:PREDICTED: protein SIEVE ELEMENT OCCLUSION B-like [Ipomoea nil]|uniref:protein SIEVE ELEMENT OCCLUSION B-like n=1 Tax=Ipomoea nil TaxID=35883 RepID=UPI000901B466|nr:PREDICTED: protein SIEVE ELEMENT OCCLUSION B-like [Ipomoea nil]